MKSEAGESGDVGPEFARRMAAIVASMGVTSVEEGTIELLCEAAHQHATETLEAGVRAASHAGRGSLQSGDLQLGSVALRLGAAQPASNVEVAEAARVRNNSALPRLRAGVVLATDAALAAQLDGDTGAEGLGRLEFGSAPWAGGRE